MTDTSDDFLLALQLQQEYDKEREAVIPEEVWPSPTPSSAYSVTAQRTGTDSSKVSLADESWELIDPNPDIRILFMQYNDRFFWGRLAGVEVRWSPRMTLCAGLCVYEGRGGLCSVRLSLPLLKLRPRKDLVETLLHEMIHAYLFVTDNNKDHDGHGPEFHKHMYRINKEAGVNITVYHSFHDEVAEYKKHWWRCNGPCQHRKPFFGYVKRAMNRAPGPNDNWWKDHQNSCNGVFIKIKEPEDYGKKKKSQKDAIKTDSKDKKDPKSKNNNMDIRVFVGKGNVLGNTSASATVTSESAKEHTITSKDGIRSKESKSSKESKGSKDGKSYDWFWLIGDSSAIRNTQQSFKIQIACRRLENNFMSGNLTGSARKVKDGAADLHNTIQKWSKYNSESLNIVNEIANIKLNTIFEQEKEENDGKSLPIPEELEPLCTQLSEYLEKFDRLVSKIEALALMFHGIKNLEDHNNKEKETDVILFKTWPVGMFEQRTRALLDMYKKEAEAKRVIAENICHVKDRNTMMCYTASWVHQPYINEATHSLYLEGMLVETGHK